MDQGMICRVCMEDDGENFTSVFTDGSGVTAAVMIVDCTGVEVDKDDGMPEMICNGCLCAIREAHKIRSKCRNTDRKLRKILNLGIKPPVEKEVCQVSVREMATQTEEMQLESSVEEPHPLRSEQLSPILPEMAEQPLVEKEGAIPEPVHAQIENSTLDVQLHYEVEQVPVVLVKQEKNQSETPVYDTEYLVEDLKEGAGDEPEVESIEEPEERGAVKQCETVLEEDQNDKHCIKIEVETLDELEYENYEAIEEDEEILQSEEPVSESCSDEIVSCCGCPCEFKSMAELKVHSELLHFELGPGSGILDEFTCEICFKEHPSLKTLAQHKANRYNKAQRTCSICRIVLPNVRKKKQHESLHKSLPKEFHVNCCGCRHLIPFDQYGIHSEQVHQTEGRVYATKYICEMCFTDCGSKSQLESHQTRYEAYIQQNKLVKPVPFDDKLGIVFSDADGKQRFVCDICEKNFSTKGNLKSHRILHDSSQKPVFKCTLCNPQRDFSKKNNYNVHMLRTHSTESLCCPHCGKSFKCSINLKTHMRVHTKERPYLCGYCSKTFAHLSDKRRHEITHTHQYPFRCDRCSKPFTRKTVLDRHLESCGQRINKTSFIDPLKAHSKLLQQQEQQQQDPIDFLLPTDIQTLEEGTYETEVEIE